MRELPDPMASSIRRPWRPATALALGLSCTLAAPAARPAQPAMLDAGTEGGYAFTIEASTVAREGNLVRFRLLAVNEAGADRYDSYLELDCAHRTRRQLTATADDGQGHVQHYGAEMASPHPISAGTRAERELRLACNRVGLQAAEAPRRAAAASDTVDAGTDAAGAHAIFDHSLRGDHPVIDYMLQTIAPGQAFATRQHVLVDCDRKLRTVLQDDASAADPRAPARRVASASREARELAIACALPEGPRSRWFAGVVVTPDGVVLAPRARVAPCDAVVTGYGPARRSLERIATEGDLALLRIRGGGPWQVMPATGKPVAREPEAITVMGLSGVQPRVSAAFAEPTGAEERGRIWPQVRTLEGHALPEGLVWNAAGTAVGVALAFDGSVVRVEQTTVRLLPAEEIRRGLARNRLTWQTAGAAAALDPEQAMRLALASTLPLTCGREGLAR